jgi:CIC family chloride channel protein
LEDIRRDMFKYDQYDVLHVFNFMKSAPAYVYVGEKMDSVMIKFEQTEAWNLPVVKDDRTYVGFVSKSKIFSSYREQLKQVSHD